MPLSRFQLPLVIVPLMFMGCDDADLETSTPSEPEEPFVSSFDVHVEGAVDEILIEDLEPEPSLPASKPSSSSPREPAKPAARASKEKTAKKTRT
ncbi:MAG TPA: hypothetical protein DIU15_13390, partial [Deltaproteobacteria bacterium]|nr:hypothetical protein [Deltaproteobacteria bacterium]